MDYLKEQLQGIQLGENANLQAQIKPILANQKLFGVDLVEAGLAELIEADLAEMLQGPGAVAQTLHQKLNQVN
jgi:fructuronate reductase